MARAMSATTRVRRSPLGGVEVLEVRTLLSAAVIQWQMAPRFGPDPTRGGTISLPNTPAYVNPTGGYQVILDASKSRGVQRRSTFTWTITPAEGSPIIVTGKTPTVRLPEGNYSVQLQANNLRGSSGPQFTTSPVDVNDILIVSMGDSYASGEGNPVVPGFFFFKSAQWAYSPDPAMNLENANAHRSTIAGPAQFALAVENSDPHTSVTFVSVANSGATIPVGMLGPMPSIGDPNYMLPAEVDELRRIVGTRPIDVMSVSIGANDVGFSTRVKQLIGNTEIGYPTLDAIGSQVDTDLAALPDRYSALAAQLQTFAPSKLMITEYPDLTRNSSGQVAPIVFAGSTIINTAAVQFAVDRIITPLDQAIQTAATANQWTYVGGLSAAFRTHGYPSSNSWIRSIGGSLQVEDSTEGAFHPNAQGHQAVATQLLATYDATILGNARGGLRGLVQARRGATRVSL